MKVQFNVEWLTVSRLNRLETFFRICDFFFLLEVILLLCYRGSTESDVLLIQLIPSLKSHQGTSFLLFSQNARSCTAQDRRTVEWIMFVVSRMCERHAEFISIWFPTIFMIAHKPRFSFIDLYWGKEDLLKLHSPNYVKQVVSSRLWINNQLTRSFLNKLKYILKLFKNILFLFFLWIINRLHLTNYSRFH